MPDLLIILLVVAIAMLGILLLIGLAILKCLGRLEIQMRSSQVAQPELHKDGREDGSGGAFEAFLSEDPNRLALSKSEQFAEFRKWRKEKGMNWSA